MDVTLSIAERILLLQLLGQMEGNLVLLRQVRELQQQVGFSEEETEALAFHYEGSRLLWTEGTVPPKALTVSPLLHEGVGKLLMQESEAGRLSMSHLSVCDKFLPEETDA